MNSITELKDATQNLKDQLNQASDSDEKNLVRRQYIEDVFKILDEAVLAISSEQKVAFYDAQAQQHVENIKEELLDRMDETYTEDQNTEEAEILWELFRVDLFGSGVFSITNQWEDLF